MVKIQIILKNKELIQESLVGSNFSLDSLLDLYQDYRQLMHFHDVSNKINKKDRIALENLDPNSPEFKRRELLLKQDEIQSSLRNSQINELENEIQVKLEKLDSILKESGVDV